MWVYRCPSQEENAILPSLSLPPSSIVRERDRGSHPRSHVAHTHKLHLHMWKSRVGTYDVLCYLCCQRSFSLLEIWVCASRSVRKIAGGCAQCGRGVTFGQRSDDASPTLCDRRRRAAEAAEARSDAGRRQPSGGRAGRTRRLRTWPRDRAGRS